jgi:hypothetical protein
VSAHLTIPVDAVRTRAASLKADNRLLDDCLPDFGVGHLDTSGFRGLAECGSHQQREDKNSDCTFHDGILYGTGFMRPRGNGKAGQWSSDFASLGLQAVHSDGFREEFMDCPVLPTEA